MFFVELEENDEPIEPNLFEKISEVPILEALKRRQIEIVTIMISRLKFKETSIKAIFLEVTKVNDAFMDDLENFFQIVDNEEVIVEATRQGYLSAIQSRATSKENTNSAL